MLIYKELALLPKRRKDWLLHPSAMKAGGGTGFVPFVPGAVKTRSASRSTHAKSTH